jgi:hypothetical protein
MRSGRTKFCTAQKPAGSRQPGANITQGLGLGRPGGGGDSTVSRGKHVVLCHRPPADHQTVLLVGCCCYGYQIDTPGHSRLQHVTAQARYQLPDCS